nr:MAG TPA: hypothetical protein [Caudoviricetes sp.]
MFFYLLSATIQLQALPSRVNERRNSYAQTS